MVVGDVLRSQLVLCLRTGPREKSVQINGFGLIVDSQLLLSSGLIRAGIGGAIKRCFR